ncbi:MAG: zinc-ribbon domain-containing protein, partial [Desulfobacteraceae bacterium]|nr:zinc-ribbon domain-containing protein [Desulfobacteraceae bacterium]
LKAASSMEKAAENPGTAGQGMGMGLGFMMPSMISSIMDAKTNNKEAVAAKTQQCPDCKQTVPGDAGFCLYCGHQIMVLEQCSSCGKNLSLNAKFCPKCGTKVEKKEKKQLKKFCSSCGAENLSNSNFCNGCGEKL